MIDFIDSIESNITGIYRIYIPIDETHSYIGQSKNIKQRLKDHIKDLNLNRHNNNYLQFLFNNFGIELFFAEILEIAPDGLSGMNKQHWLASKEREWIEIERKNNNCLNISDGGLVTTKEYAEEANEIRLRNLEEKKKKYLIEIKEKKELERKHDDYIKNKKKEINNILDSLKQEINLIDYEAILSGLRYIESTERYKRILDFSDLIFQAKRRIWFKCLTTKNMRKKRNLKY